MIAEKTKTEAQDRAEGATEATRQEIAETLRDVAKKTTAMFTDAERAGLIGELAAQLVDADPDYIQWLTRAVRNRKQGAVADADPDREKVNRACETIREYVRCEDREQAALAQDPAMLAMITAIREAADRMDDRSKIMAFLLQQLLLATNVEEDYQTRALEALGRELLDDFERTAQDRALEALACAMAPTAGEAQTASLAMLARTINMMV